MIKRMILINSANFQFADIDLSKEIFFVGDNASGKTTTTRAIHFLYNGNGEKLAIPKTKSSFSKHYFPNDDSYIIYIFESFFIFTYKRNDSIKRWFSKQIFDINKIIKNGQLLEFKSIIEYIKEATLKVKPDSIEAYTDILYGKNKEYLDFCIAKIDQYKTFLEVYNLIFNVDKAIVTSVDIKKAIQKSLDRKDEVLNIDYDDFIRKLNEFSRAYNFFKIFDSNRDNLKNSIELKEQLIKLEEKIVFVTKAINYKSKIEIKDFDKLFEEEMILKKREDFYKIKVKKIKNLYMKFETRVKDKIKKLEKEIIELEFLKEKFDSLELEKNIELASKLETIKIDLDNKKISLNKLKEELSSVNEIIEKQIEQLKYKIGTTIPNEMNKKLINLSEIEQKTCDEDIFEIEQNFLNLEKTLNRQIEELDNKIKEQQSKIDNMDYELSKKIKNLRKVQEEKLELLRKTLKDKNIEISSNEQIVRNLQAKKDEKDSQLRKHNEKYQELRKSNAKTLWNHRKSSNDKIFYANSILYPIKNSFNEFLSNNIDDWEKVIYPIIDKNLLIKSCDELKPVKFDIEVPISFKIDISNLETIPTKDEAIEIIKREKYSKMQALKNAKAVYKDEVAKLDENKNKFIAEIESLNLEVGNIIKQNEELNRIIKEDKIKIEELEISLEKDISEIQKKYTNEIEELNNIKIELENSRDIKKKNEVLALKNKKLEEIKKRRIDRDKNIDLLKKKIEKETNIVIEKEKEEIENLKSKLKKSDDDSLIKSLFSQINNLEKDYAISYDADKYLREYEEKKDEILILPAVQQAKNNFDILLENRGKLLNKIEALVEQKTDGISNEIGIINLKKDKYEKGIKKYKQLEISIEDELETNEYLIDLIFNFEELSSEYRNKKSKFREFIDKLKKLEKHSLIDINFNNEKFDEVNSIVELNNIIESLNELDNFEKNKYESEKKRRHNNFDTFLKNTIPSKIQSFDDLEIDFERAKNSINKSLSNADFGVIKNIRLNTDSSKKRNDSIAYLMRQLNLKAKDTTMLYSKNSLFYFDITKSVDNISDIQSILEEIKQRGSSGMINLFDTIDLTISYTENGKNIENKHNIKDDSSSGGNILLKVAIAMSILSRYAKKVENDTPFFLIIDEVSKLQSKNQNLIKEYINQNGFKTLFITPDPAYPDPQKALFYTFKNIQEEGETLEIRQMNII